MYIFFYMRFKGFVSLSPRSVCDIAGLFCDSVATEVIHASKMEVGFWDEGLTFVC